MERRIGESIMRDIRFREPSYLDDPEITDYLGDARRAPHAGAPRARARTSSSSRIRDPTINAFALPGGFIGVHTGLISAAETESELASVLAHEIAHVTQRHIARMLGQQQQMQLPVLAALAAAILLGALAARPRRPAPRRPRQAGAVQTQLSYSRDFEREADRIGFQALEARGLRRARDGARSSRRCSAASRIADDGSVPGYLRTHPMTTERIADAQNRAAGLPYQQHPDSPEFQLVRAKLRAEPGDARDAVQLLPAAVRERRYASEAAARYGLAAALLRAQARQGSRGRDRAAARRRRRAGR